MHMSEDGLDVGQNESP